MELLFVIGWTLFWGSISAYCFTRGYQEYSGYRRVRRRVREMQEAIYRCQK